MSVRIFQYKKNASKESPAQQMQSVGTFSTTCLVSKDIPLQIMQSTGIFGIKYSVSRNDYSVHHVQSVRTFQYKKISQQEYAQQHIQSVGINIQYNMRSQHGHSSTWMKTVVVCVRVD